MAKHIGIVACSPEGAALCYRTICKEAHKQMGKHMNPEVSIHSVSFDQYIGLFEARKWDDVAKLMLASSKKLASMGADFAICPDNTVHEAYDLVAPNSPIPWMSILEEVGKEAKNKGYDRVGILGTEYVMTSPLYQKKLHNAGIKTEIPDDDDRRKINKIVYNELANGVFTERHRAYFYHVIDRLKQDGVEAVILGCTEIPMLVTPYDCPLPTLDSTQILAQVALRRALAEE
jgi:aspartate racemase